MLDNFVTYTDCVPAFGSLDRQTLIDHVGYLRNHSKTVETSLDIRFLYPERNNFYAYCKLAGINVLLIYPIMLLNNISSPLDFDVDRTTILIPDLGTVSEILESARI